MAGVIRKEQFTRPGAFSFADLERQGQAILERAQQQAREITAAARREALTISAHEQRRARAEGLAAGHAAGLQQIRAEAHAAAVQQARQEISALAAVLRSALEDFDQAKRGLIAAAETGLIELALAVARRVCKSQAGSCSAAALANARALLEMVQHAEDVELRVHPAELELLQEMAPDLAATSQQCAHVQFLPDETVAHGGCILRTRAGQIDSGIELQIQRIAEALCTAARQPDTAQPPPPVRPDAAVSAPPAPNAHLAGEA